MILSDKDIKLALSKNEIEIDPLFEDAFQPASVDLHLGSHFLVFKNTNDILDPKQPIDHLMEEVIIDKDTPFILNPNQFALGLVYETTGVSAEYVGRLEGKSSLGRLGLLVHATAGYLDPGNKLKMTLELHNLAPLPLKLYYRMPIAQMAFEKLSSAAEAPYGQDKLNSKYLGDTKPVASQFYKNFLKNSSWLKYD